MGRLTLWEVDRGFRRPKIRISPDSELVINEKNTNEPWGSRLLVSFCPISGVGSAKDKGPGV